MRKILLYIVGLVVLVLSFLILKAARDSQITSSRQVEPPLPNYVIQYATLSSNDVKQENDLQVSRDKVTSPLATSSTKPVTSKPVTQSASLTSSLTSSTVELSTSTTEKPTRNPHQVNSTEMNNTHVRNRLMESVIVTDYVKNIYFSIKTTTKYHGTRLPVLMLTWFQAVKDKVFIVTDGLPNNPYVDKMQKAGFNVIVTPCQPRATVGYCCKIGMGFADYYKAVQQHKDDKDSYQWFCHFDDDIYVNIPQLSKLLQQYDSNKPYYVGKWLSKIRHKPNVSVKNESLVKLKAMNMTMKLHKFRYATGASFCISQALMIEAKPYFNGQDKFYKNCLLADYPDDMTVGFVIGILLGYNVTNSDLLFNQYDNYKAKATTKQKLLNYITISYKASQEPTYGHSIPLTPLFEDDPTRFMSYHCLLYPNVSWCQR